MPSITATAIVGASAVGAVGSGIASNNAANAQKSAASDARTAFNTEVAPFTDLGGRSTGALNYLMGYTGDPSSTGIAATSGLPSGYFTQRFPLAFAPPTDEASLAATPGYKFALAQGLKANENLMSSKGLGLSGAQIKGASDFATGLADQTYGNQFDRYRAGYQQQFDNFLAQKNDLYNKLIGGVQIGANAASGAASNASNLIQGAGNASAAASIATGNAISSAGNSVGQGILFNNLLSRNQPQTGINSSNAQG